MMKGEGRRTKEEGGRKAEGGRRKEGGRKRREGEEEMFDVLMLLMLLQERNLGSEAKGGLYRQKREIQVTVVHDHHHHFPLSRS